MNTTRTEPHRAIAAALTFILLMLVAFVVGHRASWFPREPVYRLPAWTPLNLGMIDEAIEATRKQAKSNRYAILIGDSIPHGDGYGRPSESLAAQTNRLFPTANITSPSLAYAPQRELLHHVLTETDAPLVLMQINLKWVSHEWVPEKFASLMDELAARERKHATARDVAKDIIGRVADGLLLKEARLKGRYRLSNFTLSGFAANGLKPEPHSLWASEMRQEKAPTYDIQPLAGLPPDQAKSAAQYHRLTAKDIDDSVDLNKLIQEMRTAPSRIAAILTPLNPEWSRVLAPGMRPHDAEHHLAEKLRSAGIRVLMVHLDGDDDYRDDMHLSKTGVLKAARQVADFEAEFQK